MFVYCQRCNRDFPHERALRQHEANSAMHHICHRCDRDFDSYTGLKEHFVQSPQHDYCQYCDEHFSDEYELEGHYEFSPSCRRIFKHDTGRGEYSRWYCETCDRHFQSESNLDAHLNSSLHKPKNFFCPAPDCGRAFVSISALTLHCEAGTCPSGMTRAEVNRRVSSWDRNNVITNPTRLIAGPDGYASATTTTKTWATERSWNSTRNAFECFLCHGAFGKLGALNAHLNSPRHEEKIYRCPNGTCGVQYSVLSALTQHVESGKCGVRMFREVQNVMQSLASGMKSITGF